MVGRFFQLIIWFDRDFSSAPSGLAKSSPLIQGRRAARLPLATVFRAFGAHLTFEAKPTATRLHGFGFAEKAKIPNA